MKQEKNDKVSLNISQTAIVLIIAMVFTGLSIQIARFHSHSRRGRMRGSKIPVQELWLKMGGGRIRKGGRNSGILRYMYFRFIRYLWYFKLWYSLYMWQLNVPLPGSEI